MSETFTEKLKLSKRDTGDLNWGQGANANLDLLDVHGQQGTLRPPRTLLASLGSGAVGPELVGSTTYFYKITAFNPSGETRENQFPTVLEAQITEPGTPVPIVLQWETVKGAAGYRVYKSTTSGQERFLVEVTGEATATHTDDGNTAVNTGISVPTTNTALTALRGLRKTGETDFLRGDVELEAVLPGAIDPDRLRARQSDLGQVGGPAGRRDEHLVPRAEQGEDAVEEGLLDPRADQDAAGLR